MGERLHVATTYEVKWGSEGFNWCWYELLQDIEEEGFSVFPEADDLGCTCDVEIPVEELKAYIAKKKKALVKGNVSIRGNESVADRPELDLRDLIDTLEAMLKEADTRDGFVHFGIF